MRLFTAVDLPDDILERLETLQRKLKPLARIGWSAVSNFHITMKFVGEWPEARLGEVQAALDALPERTAMTVAVRGFGFFPNAKAPRVFWVGITAPQELAALARETDEALARLGVAAETHPYSPHLTLARIREPLPLERLHEEVRRSGTPEFGSFVADRFFLYLSKTSPGGSVYTKLSEHRFTR